MSDKAPYLAAELGTYSTTGPVVTLSGTAVRMGVYPSRTFAKAAADASTDFGDGDTCTVTIFSGSDNWAIYSAAAWADLASDTLDLSAATLEASEGTLADGAAVYAFASSAASAALLHSHVLADITDAGTAAAEDVGTGAGHVVQLDGSSRLPAVDGSLLTGLTSGVTDHGALTGLADDDHTQYHTDARGDTRYSAAGHGHTLTDVTDAGTVAALDSGVDIGDVPILTDVGGGTPGLPAVDGSQLTGLPGGDLIDDTSPELGGDLDVGDYGIVSSSDRDIDIAAGGTGTINLSSEVQFAEGLLTSAVADGVGEAAFTLNTENTFALGNLFELNNSGDMAFSMSRDAALLSMGSSAASATFTIHRADSHTRNGKGVALKLDDSDGTCWFQVRTQGHEYPAGRMSVKIETNAGLYVNLPEYAGEATNGGGIELYNPQSTGRGAVVSVPDQSVSIVGTDDGSVFKIGEITYNKSGGGVFDAMAAMHIVGPPIAGAFLTAKTRLSLWVDDGDSRFDGQLLLNNNYTNASNYERAALGWDGDVFTIGAEAAGTGTQRNISIDAPAVGIGHASPDTILDVNGALTLREQSADPSDPDEGATALWMSDGTGSGDDGDILLKTTAASATNKFAFNAKAEFKSYVADGVGVAAYSLDTSNAFALGNLFELKNNGDDKVIIGQDDAEVRLGGSNRTATFTVYRDYASTNSGHGSQLVLSDRNGGTSASISLISRSAVQGRCTVEFANPFGVFMQTPAEYGHSTNGGVVEFFAVGSASAPALVAIPDQNVKTIGGADGSLLNIGDTSFYATSTSTIDNLSSIHVHSAPIAGTKLTATNTYAVWVEDGTTRLDGDVVIGGISAATALDINGALTLRELPADPADPDEGATALWMSDGTGSGDDGDVMMKITAGGSTKTVTLVDFSAA